MSWADALAALQTARASVAATSIAPAPLDAAIADVQALAGDYPIFSLALDLTNIVCDTAQWGSSRYERFQNPLILTATAVSLPFHGRNLAGGGSGAPFAYPRYEWAVDGVTRASYTRKASEYAGTLVGALADEADGLHAFDIFGIAADGTRKQLMRHYGYIDRNGGAKNETRVALQTCSREWDSTSASGISPVCYQAVVLPISVAMSTRVKPLTPRLGVPFSTALPMTQLTKINLSPVTRNGNVPKYPLCVTKSGVRVSEQRMSYFKGDQTFPYPILPLIDGPRGVGTIPMPLNLIPGRNGRIGYGTVWSPLK